MQTQTLTKAVHDNCPNLDTRRVSRCTWVTLDTLAEHLDSATSDHVAAALADDAAAALRMGAARGQAAGQPISLEQFVDKLRRRLELPPAQAESLLYAVAITLSFKLDDERLAALARTLPAPLGRLFQL